jgi:hypothetical protein
MPKLRRARIKTIGMSRRRSNKNQKLEAALAALPELAKAIGEDAAAREARRELPFEAFALFRRVFRSNGVAWAARSKTSSK